MDENKDFNEEDFDELDNKIILNDEAGNEIEFEFLDVVVVAAGEIDTVSRCIDRTVHAIDVFALTTNCIGCTQILVERPVFRETDPDAVDTGAFFQRNESLCGLAEGRTVLTESEEQRTAVG